MSPGPGMSSYGDCVSCLRSSLSHLESSVNTLGKGVHDHPRLAFVLKTHFELIPQPALALAEASLRDEIGPFVAALLDRADRQLERQARRIGTLKARAELNAGRLSLSQSQLEEPSRERKPTGRKSLKLGGEAGLRDKVVRQRKEALRYGVERLELEVLQKERELRMRLDAA